MDGITFLPASFHIHPKLGWILREENAVRTLAKDYWARGTGALVERPLPSAASCSKIVRFWLSGQDSGRGTFSQRHLAFYDFEGMDTA